MTALTKQDTAATGASLALSDVELMQVLGSSIYPGAKPESIKMVISYCRAARLDPLQKPVHIVPMDVSTGKKDANGWDITEKRDVVMPGIGLYRIQAAKSGEHVGTSEAEFGPDVSVKMGPPENIMDVTYPQWCKVTVRRRMHDGLIVEYPAVERWLENYAVGPRKGGNAPNRMWAKRPYAQLAKCAEAQALRKAFPEVGSQPTAEEMEGKVIDASTLAGEVVGQAEGAGAVIVHVPPELLEAGRAAAAKGSASYGQWFEMIGMVGRRLVQHEHEAWKIKADEADEARKIGEKAAATAEARPTKVARGAKASEDSKAAADKGTDSFVAGLEAEEKRLAGEDPAKDGTGVA